MNPKIEVIERGPWLAVGPIRRAEWLRVTLELAQAPPSGLRLMHLSDLHLRGRMHPVLNRVIERLNAQLFDAVLVTGDFVDDQFDAKRVMPVMRHLLTLLRSRWGTFGILGNHDGDPLRAWLGGLGVNCIEGRRVRLGEPAEPQLDLVGLPGVLREASSCFFDRDRDPRVPTIALSHYPDAVGRCGRLRPDVILAGHTHGGQIALPGQIPIITHDSLTRKMCNGVHKTEHGWLIVSRGIGHTDVPIRLFAPPQIVELVLTRPTPGIS